MLLLGAFLAGAERYDDGMDGERTVRERIGRLRYLLLGDTDPHPEDLLDADDEDE